MNIQTVLNSQPNGWMDGCFGCYDQLMVSIRGIAGGEGQIFLCATHTHDSHFSLLSW